MTSDGWYFAISLRIKISSRELFSEEIISPVVISAKAIPKPFSSIKRAQR